MHIAVAERQSTPQLDLLDEDDRQAVDRKKTPLAKSQAGSARALLRLLLTSLTGAPPMSHRFDRHCLLCHEPHGKPRLRSSTWHTSLSYAGDLVAVAATTAGPVGVDVEAEAATAFAGFDGVALGLSERAPTPADRSRTWTRKEAVLKATGHGLSQDPRDVVVSAPDQLPRVVRWAAGPPYLQLYDVPCPPGYACAVAVVGTGPLTWDVLSARRVVTLGGVGAPGRRSTAAGT